MELNAETYYSPEMNWKYMSVHQYLDFMSCEARAMAKLKGEWKDEKTLPMMVGSYVDCAFEGTLDKFKKDNPELFTQKGELKAPYKQAEKMIERAKQDDYFMATMGFERQDDGTFKEIGKKQEIMSAYWCGCDWKIKMDSYIPDVAVCDLKTSSSDLHKAWRLEDGSYVSCAEKFGYCHQAGVYTKVVEINAGKRLPFYLSFITKEDYPELCVANVDETTMEHYRNEIEANMPQILMVKSGEIEPIRCERCSYCKATRKLKGAISLMDLINE